MVDAADSKSVAGALIQTFQLFLRAFSTSENCSIPLKSIQTSNKTRTIFSAFTLTFKVNDKS